MNMYDAGNVVVVTATFSEDPASVELKYQPPGGTTVTLTYEGATIPAVGTVARTASGVYSTWFDTTGSAGEWVWEVVASGVGQSAGYAAFEVRALPL